MSRSGLVVLTLVLAALLPAAAVWPAAAQTSASYKLQEYAVNAGGSPHGGLFAASASYRVKLDAIGDAATRPTLSSASYHSDGGFLSGYPAPGEVLGLSFASDRKTLNWKWERSGKHFELYRDLLTNLPGTFGTCFQAAIPSNTWTDTATPPSSNGYFYLVTVRNRLGEEGTKGYRSNSAERPNLVPCP